MSLSHVNYSVNWHMEELTARIVADSGIPGDRFHIGKMIYQSFKDDVGFVHQIDGATVKSETAGSMLSRSVKCAISLEKLGLKQGDVICLMAPNHLDLAVPFYAALYLGATIAPVDRTSKHYELEMAFKKIKPKIIFCQRKKVNEIIKMLEAIESEARVIQFEDEKESNVTCFSELLQVRDEEAEIFRPKDFNAEVTTAFLVPTSGTTGLPKYAAVTYKCWAITGPNILSRFTTFPTPFHLALVLSPLQWFTAYIHYFLAPILKYTRLQTSQENDDKHTIYLINTYRPQFMGYSPTRMSSLLSRRQGVCDLTCFKMIMIGGSAVPKELILEIKNLTPTTEVVEAYGMTEITNHAFQGPSRIGSCGRPVGIYQYRLIDMRTLKDINEPHVKGELWIKGPGIFTEYYNDPKATQEAFEDGWLKTGDIFYKDEHENYFFVERIKTMLKYMSLQVSPVELERVIRSHPGVMDVAVTGIKDPLCGDLPVACVVPRGGAAITASQIHRLVRENLCDIKQLRGGVIFMESLPVTSSTKIDRRKLNEMVLSEARQVMGVEEK